MGTNNTNQQANQQNQQNQDPMRKQAPGYDEKQGQGRRGDPEPDDRLAPYRHASRGGPCARAPAGVVTAAAGRRPFDRHELHPRARHRHARLTGHSGDAPDAHNAAHGR